MKKILFPAVLFFWFANSAATIHTTPGNRLQASGTNGSYREDACFLGYVDGLTITSTGTTSISLAWDPVQGAAYYRVKTFDSVNKAFISSLLVVAKPGNNVATVIDLIPGISYSFVVVGVCANGQEGL